MFGLVFVWYPYYSHFLPNHLGNANICQWSSLQSAPVALRFVRRGIILEKGECYAVSINLVRVETEVRAEANVDNRVNSWSSTVCRIISSGRFRDTVCRDQQRTRRYFGSTWLRSSSGPQGRGLQTLLSDCHY